MAAGSSVGNRDAKSGKTSKTVRIQITRVHPNSRVEAGWHTAKKSLAPSLKDGHGRKWRTVRGDVVAEGKGLVQTHYESSRGTYGYFRIGQEWYKFPLFDRELKIGSRVKAKWNDNGKWYVGSIQAESEMEFYVDFEDGDIAWVSRSHVEWLDPYDEE